ncbi:MAG: glucose/arabinose dehydrogenase [Salinirussus sp.]|jgi:glucose/arabinose dehydrogenase
MSGMRRRTVLATLAAGTAGLAGCSRGAPEGGGNGDRAGSDSDTGSDTVTGGVPDAVSLATVAAGLRAPLDIAFAPDADRRYIAEQRGVVHVDGSDGVRATPLLDLRETVVTGFEQGLLGLALHPEFADNRRLFVRYSAPARGGTPDSASHTFVLAEFTVAADGRTVVPGSERTVLEIPEPQGNHNAGSIVFGPEGYLYVGVGDGGAGGDQGGGHVGDWYGAVPGGNGQDVTENLLGSVLRLDVDDREGDRGYAVPDDNPLVGRAGLEEHYAWGFRNPWRLSVDGDTLYAGDVGQNRYEEIDRVERGGNYGWNVREGRHCFDAQGCPDSTSGDIRGGERLRDPVLEYPHGGEGVSGISVIIGNVYRGSAVPGLDGLFVFADYRANGRLFVADPADGWASGVLSLGGGVTVDQVLSVDRGPAGEMYVLGAGEGGGVYRVEPV